MTTRKKPASKNPAPVNSPRVTMAPGAAVMRLFYEGGAEAMPQVSPLEIAHLAAAMGGPMDEQGAKRAWDFLHEAALACHRKGKLRDDFIMAAGDEKARRAKRVSECGFDPYDRETWTWKEFQTALKLDDVFLKLPAGTISALGLSPISTGKNNGKCGGNDVFRAFLWDTWEARFNAKLPGSAKPPVADITGEMQRMESEQIPAIAAENMARQFKEWRTLTGKKSQSLAGSKVGRGNLKG